MMRVGLIYAGEKQVMLNCVVAEETTVEQAIKGSGILAMCQDIDLKKTKIGVYGRLVNLDRPLKDGDRIEIYRKVTRILDEDDDDDDDDE